MMITAHLLVVSVTDERASISPPMYPTAIMHLCKLAGTNGVTGRVASFPSKAD